MNTDSEFSGDQVPYNFVASVEEDDSMKIGLKSGKTFECEDISYTESNKLNGELIHIFISLKDRKKYTVNSADVEFFESTLSDDDIEELASYGDDDDVVRVDHSFV